MKTPKYSTFNKTVGLIVLTHLFFFVILVLLYYQVLNQEESLIHYYKLLKATNSQYEHVFSTSFYTIKNTLLLLSVLVFISLTAYLVFVRKNLFHPIKLITNALETNSKKCIKLLKNIPGEFSYIGNLFQNNDNHKFELVSAKIKAEESERLKSTFLENLSHEIRTPMNAIIGFTDLMLTTSLNENEKKEYLSIIHKSGTGLISIIEDLIEMSKIDTNQIEPNYTDIDLDKCLIELYNTIKVNIPKAT